MHLFKILGRFYQFVAICIRRVVIYYFCGWGPWFGVNGSDVFLFSIHYTRFRMVGNNYDNIG